MWDVDTYSALLLELLGAGLTLLLLGLSLLEKSLGDNVLLEGDRAVEHMLDGLALGACIPRAENCGTAAFSAGSRTRLVKCLIAEAAPLAQKLYLNRQDPETAAVPGSKAS